MTDERLRIAPAHLAHCELCANPLDTRKPGVHQWTCGWVMQRTGGGGHGISLPQRSARYAHDDCVRKAVNGLLDQPTLFTPT